MTSSTTTQTEPEIVPTDGDDVPPPEWEEDVEYRLEILSITDRVGHTFHLYHHVVRDVDNPDAAIASDVICPLDENL